MLKCGSKENVYSDHGQKSNCFRATERVHSVDKVIVRLCTTLFIYLHFVKAVIPLPLPHSFPLLPTPFLVASNTFAIVALATYS